MGKRLMDKPILNVDYNTGKKEKEDGISSHWWNHSKHDCAKAIWASIENNTTLEQRRRLNTRNAILYESSDNNRELAGYPHNFGKVPNYNSDSMGYNVIKSVIDTIVSKITKNKPKVQYLTEGGNNQQQNRAKNLTSYVNSTFHQADIYQIASETFKNSCIFGTGAFKIYKDKPNKKISAEKVLIDEIIVDEAEAIYGKPKTLHQIKYLNKWVLLKLYPNSKDILHDAETLSLANMGDTDLVAVAESWRLPVSGSVGKHCISIKSGLLFEEEYKHKFFPFVFLRWETKQSGFFGTGIADSLANAQVEINFMLERIMKGIDLVAVPRIFMPYSADIDEDEMDNEVAKIISYNNMAGDGKPTVINSSPFGQEIYNHLLWRIQSAYELIGVSQLSAKSEKPSGLNSSVSMRTMQNIETERFFTIADNYQESFLHCAKIILGLSKELDEELEGKLWVNGLDGNDTKKINWKDCSLEEDQYILKAWPVNMLPDRPEGKMEYITEMVQSGIIDRRKAPNLLQYPDIQAELNLEYAGEKLIDKILGKILETGEYTPPEPYFNLEYAIKAAQNHYNLGKLDRVEDSRLFKVLIFMDDCQRLLEKSAEMDKPEMTNVDPNLEPSNQEAMAMEMAAGGQQLPIDQGANIDPEASLVQSSALNQGVDEPVLL